MPAIPPNIQTRLRSHWWRGSSREQEMIEREALNRKTRRRVQNEKVSRLEARALFLTLGSHLTNQEAS